jgi:guanylate cyclase
MVKKIHPKGLGGLSNFSPYVSKWKDHKMFCPYLKISLIKLAMVLQYRSKRRGFHHYVQGQTKEVAQKLFNLKVDIKLQKQEVLFDTVICTYDLKFDNGAYKRSLDNVQAKP